jgi:hypothetical protein
LARSDAAEKEFTRRTQIAQRAEAADKAAQEAVKSAADKERLAKAYASAAAEISAKATAEAQATAKAASVAQDAVKAAAQSQPKGEGLIAIASADIAALARVLDPSDEGKTLFCRDRRASLAPAAAGNHAVTATATGATPGTLPSVTAPLPLARPSIRN